MTIIEALINKVHYPIPYGFIETVLIERGLDKDADYSAEVLNSDNFKGAWADCLYSLITAVNFSESDKSIGSLSEDQRDAILVLVNKLYSSIGEDEVEDSSKPMVYISSD